MGFMRHVYAAALSRKRLLISYCVIFVVGSILLITRYYLGAEKAFGFLLWNFSLALLPLILSSLMIQMELVGARTRAMVLSGILWMLFLPNAPYMMTDFIHLRYGSHEFFLLDMFTLAWFVVPAFIAAIISINDIAGLLLKRWRSWQVSIVVLLICSLCSLGIYLGRDLRFNSWDMMLNPTAIIAESMEHFSNPYADLYTWMGAAAIGLLLFMTYQAGRVMKRMF